MRVWFSERFLTFKFHSFANDAEKQRIHSDLSAILLNSDVMQPYDSILETIDGSVLYTGNGRTPTRGKEGFFTGPCFQVKFLDEQAAMTFKLAYIEGENFIPWQAVQS